MTELKADNYSHILDRIKNKKIVVLGDLMLDRYIWGSVRRISPEAPVPVVEVESQSTSLGGAANVANNVRSLSAQTIPVGVVGNDKDGKALLEFAEEAGFQTGGIIQEPERQSTIKTRVMAHNQHVVRIDSESKTPISKQTYRKILTFLESVLPDVNAVIIQDYNKGLISNDLIAETITLARKNQIIVTVDPKFDHFLSYKNVTVFKPNRKEIEEALGLRLRNENEIKLAAEKLKKELCCENVLITLGEDGMHVLDSKNNHYSIPTQAKKVHDVSGAGDTVIGTLTCSLVAGASMYESAILANFAAGIVVGEIGAVPVLRKKLHEEIVNFEKQEKVF